MSPRLPWPRGGVRTRLPVVVVRRDSLHPDAADWVARVQANGSSVSAATADAVSAFCVAIDAAGIRSRIYRLNLFAGGAGSSDTTRLNAALVPLYRGPSLGGTQYGGTTDTNAGGASAFITTDFSDSVGLTASGTKYLDTGLQTSALPAGVIDSGHLSLWHGALSSAAAVDPYLIGAWNGATDRVYLQVSYRNDSSVPERIVYGKTTLLSASSTIQGARPAAFLLGQRTSATNLELWKNGSSAATPLATSTTGIAGIPYNIFVFRVNFTGSVFGDQAASTTLRHYSIGDDMTTLQVGAFYDALSAFNAAMGRV